MSRSRKKFVICGIACGSNTEYYRDANRKLRTVCRRIMTLFRLGRIDEDTIQFPTKHKDVGYNDWDEPTDGHYREGDPYFPYWRLDKLKRK